MKDREAIILPNVVKPMPTDKEIRKCILKIAEKRGVNKSLCPSEAARDLQPDDWRPLMGEVRRVTASLVKEGLVTATQFGKPVDPLDAKGHIRISLSRKSCGESKNTTH